MLLEKHHGEDGLRAQPHEAGHPAAEAPRDTLLPRDVSQQRDNASARVLGPGAHDPRLDHVNGAANGRGDEAGGRAGQEVGGGIVAHTETLQARLLECVVAGELAGRHERRADAVGPDPLGEAGGAFVAHHADQPVERMCVVASLIWRFGEV